MVRAHTDGLDQALRESIATKADVEALGRVVTAQFEAADRKLDQKIDEVEKRLTARIDGVENRLDARTDSVEKRLDGLEKKLDLFDARMVASVSELKAQIPEGHTALMRRMIGTIFVAIGLLWAMLRYVR